MYILFCIAFILVSIFEFVVTLCIKDLYAQLDIINFINNLDDNSIYSDDFKGDSDE